MRTPEELKAYKAEYHRKRYQYLLDHKRCVICKKRDERTEDGYTRCAVCAEKCRKVQKALIKRKRGEKK